MRPKKRRQGSKKGIKTRTVRRTLQGEVLDERRLLAGLSGEDFTFSENAGRFAKSIQLSSSPDTELQSDLARSVTNLESPTLANKIHRNTAQDIQKGPIWPDPVFEYRLYRMAQGGEFDTPNLLERFDFPETPAEGQLKLTDSSSVLGRVSLNGDGTVHYVPPVEVIELSPGEILEDVIPFEISRAGEEDRSFTLTIELLSTLPGDADLDGDVDSVDLNILAINWRSEQNDWTTGDFNMDSSVDALDLNAVAANWRQNVIVPPFAALDPVESREFERDNNIGAVGDVDGPKRPAVENRVLANRRTRNESQGIATKNLSIQREFALVDYVFNGL